MLFHVQVLIDTCPGLIFRYTAMLPYRKVFSDSPFTIYLDLKEVHESNVPFLLSPLASIFPFKINNLLICLKT